MPSEANEIATYLAWDSAFFGCRIGRASHTSFSAATCEQLLAWSRGLAIDCLYVLVEAGDQASVRLLEQARFGFVDIRLTLERSLIDNDAEAPSAAEVRPASRDDLPTLQEIARASHTDSRFYADPHLPAERCADLYATWIANSVEGHADQVFVAASDDHVYGYLTCHQQGDKGSIGLVGVAANGQGRGFGSALMREGLRWFAGRGIAQINVVTQGRNHQAQRLYQRHGFLTRSVQLWYHGWLAQPSIDPHAE